MSPFQGMHEFRVLVVGNSWDRLSLGSQCTPPDIGNRDGCKNSQAGHMVPGQMGPGNQNHLASACAFPVPEIAGAEAPVLCTPGKQAELLPVLCTLG